jgi:hypothetical protein
VDREEVRGDPSVRQVSPVGTGNGYQFTPCQRRALPRPAARGRWPLEFPHRPRRQTRRAPEVRARTWGDDGIHDDQDDPVEREVVEADDDSPVIHPERPIDAWGSFDVSAHVVKIIQVARDFADRLDALFREVDPRFEDEVARRAEDSILTAFERMAAHLPVNAKRAERNRARFQVLTGGK